MLKCFACLFAVCILLSAFLTACGGEESTCEKACNTMADLCTESGFEDDTCTTSCEEAIADMADEEIDAAMACIDAADTCEIAMACSGSAPYGD